MGKTVFDERKIAESVADLDRLAAAARIAANPRQRTEVAERLRVRQRDLLRELLKAQKDGQLDMVAVMPLLARLRSQSDWGVET